MRQQGEEWLDIRNLFFEPSPQLFTKLWIITARFADPCPRNEILQCIASVLLAEVEEDVRTLPLRSAASGEVPAQS